MDDRRFDAVSLVVGAAFVALAMVFLIGGEDVYVDGQRFVWPLALIAIGLAVLASRSRR